MKLPFNCSDFNFKNNGKQLCPLASNSIEYFRNRLGFPFCYLIKNFKRRLFIRARYTIIVVYKCCMLVSHKVLFAIAFIKICNIFIFFLRFSKISLTHSFRAKALVRVILFFSTHFIRLYLFEIEFRMQSASLLFI